MKTLLTLHRDEERRQERGRELGQSDDVRARNDEHVALEHGVDIEETDDVGLVDDDRGGCFARGDRAEEANAAGHLGLGGDRLPRRVAV